MGELRNRLDRKNELRLYEWMKNEGNYGKLQDKTVTEGAEHVSRELDLKVSGSVLTSLVQAMGLDPFWKVRNTGSKRVEVEQPQGEGLAALVTRLDRQSQCLDQLKVISRNLVERLERLEARDGHDRRQRSLNGPEPKGRHDGAHQ